MITSLKWAQEYLSQSYLDFILINLDKSAWKTEVSELNICWRQIQYLLKVVAEHPSPKTVSLETQISFLEDLVHQGKKNESE